MRKLNLPLDRANEAGSYYLVHKIASCNLCVGKKTRTSLLPFMHSLRLSVLAITTMFSVALPMSASANNQSSCGTGFMATPVSMRGHFVYVNKISRRMLRDAVAQRQQPVRYAVPLIREIL